MPPEPIRWFVDENSLLLARRLSDRHPSVVHPGHPQLPQIPRGTPDEAWLRIVGELGLVVITRDTRIRYRPVERLVWSDAAVRGFVLTAAGNLRVTEQLELLEAHWVAMEQTARDLPDGPWMFAVTRRRVRRIALNH